MMVLNSNHGWTMIRAYLIFVTGTTGEEPPIINFWKSWYFVPTRGRGRRPNPNFFVKFPKNNFIGNVHSFCNFPYSFLCFGIVFVTNTGGIPLEPSRTPKGIHKESRGLLESCLGAQFGPRGALGLLEGLTRRQFLICLVIRDFMAFS